MLKLDGITITLGTFGLAVDFSLERGQKYAVIGPSGAGKSTLLGAMCGFVPISSGALILEGKDLTDAPPGARPMTMLFQDNNLFPHLTVRQNVGLGVRPDMKLSPADRNRVDDAIARVGLTGHEDARPATLSGGQQSRAALARVLVQARPLVLLDEPFAALGPALRLEMLDLVAELVRETGATLVMVTHTPDDVRRIADQVIFVEGGKAHAPAPVADLLNDPPPALRAYLG